MDSMRAKGLHVALISMVLLAGLAYVVFIIFSPAFVIEPLIIDLEKCVFSDTLNCDDWYVQDGQIAIRLSNPGSREMIIRNVSATSEFLESGFCTTRNIDGRLRNAQEITFSLGKSGTDAYPADTSYANFYADYAASADFARSSAVEAARDYAGSAVVAAILTAADADNATPDSVAEAARVAAGSVESSSDYPERVGSFARKIADNVSEAADAHNATADSASKVIFADLYEYVHYPPGREYLYSFWDDAYGASDYAQTSYSVVNNAARSTVSSVVKAANAAVADRATPEPVAATARDAADAYAAAARANASSASQAAAQASKAADTSYAPYYSSYYADYSRIKAKFYDSLKDDLDTNNALGEAISAEVPAVRFEHDYVTAIYTVFYAFSAAAYDVIPAADADYASSYYESWYSPHIFAYRAIADVANGSVSDDYFSFSDYQSRAAYEAAVQVISEDPSAVDAAYEAAINAYYEVYPFDPRDDAYSSYYDPAYAAAHDIVSAAYEAYSGSDTRDYVAVVSGFEAASDAVADYAAVYPDDPISAAAANMAAAYTVYSAGSAAMEVYPNASTADYVAYEAYARDVVASAYADVRVSDADLAVATAEYIAAAVAAAASENVINAAEVAANEAVSVARSHANRDPVEECAYTEPDNLDDYGVDGKKFWSGRKNPYKIQVTYSWADEPDVNHVIQGEMLSRAPQ